MWEHRDPFDCVLAAQAMLEQQLLVTKNLVFSTLGGLEIIW